MAGYNQYRRRWSTNLPPTRSRVAVVGRGAVVCSALLALTVVLYIFGIIGGDARHRPVAGSATVAALVPPPAPLVVPTSVGQQQPFGALPPVQPFLNVPQGLNFDYRLSGPLSGGAATADVFRITWSAPTAVQVDKLARKLGLTGPVRQPKTGTYTVDGNGKLSMEARGTVYSPPTPIPTSAIPPADDRAAINSARGWLLAQDLLPPDVGLVDVQYSTGAIAVIFHPKTLPDVLSSVPGVRVQMRADGAITEVKRAWPNELVPGAYALISLDDAWATIMQQGMPELQLPPDATFPAGMSAQTTIDNVSIAYALASGVGGDYLQPIYLFSGQATITGFENPVPVRVAVPAVRDAKQAAG